MSHLEDRKLASVAHDDHARIPLGINASDEADVILLIGLVSARQ
jgi:hypothetical protein